LRNELSAAVMLAASAKGCVDEFRQAPDADSVFAGQVK
jgi:hypothetical protein